MILFSDAHVPPAIFRRILGEVRPLVLLTKYKDVG